jgi:hypothetical protein
MADLKVMITVPLENLEGILAAVEGFFGPEISEFMQTQNDGKLADLNRSAVAIKSLIDKYKSEVQAAKSIYDAIESQLTGKDKEEIQNILDEAVLDAGDQKGSNVNNDGPEDQILFLIRVHGEDYVRNIFREEYDGTIEI